MNALLIGLKPELNAMLEPLLEQQNIGFKHLCDNAETFKNCIDELLAEDSYQVAFMPLFLHASKMSGLQMSLFVREVDPGMKLVLLADEEDPNILAMAQNTTHLYKILKAPFEQSQIQEVLQSLSQSTVS